MGNVRACIIVGGVVAQVAAFKYGDIFDGWLSIPDSAGVGWLYSDGVFTAPPEPEPEPPTVAEQIAVLEASITPRKNALNTATTRLGPLFGPLHGIMRSTSRKPKDHQKPSNC